jgi:hypothetical protein
MVEYDYIKTFPYRVRCAPPQGDPCQKRSLMEDWLRVNVSWDGRLEIDRWTEKDGRVGKQLLHFVFNVATIEDVGLIKARF